MRDKIGAFSGHRPHDSLARARCVSVGTALLLAVVIGSTLTLGTLPTGCLCVVAPMLLVAFGLVWCGVGEVSLSPSERLVCWAGVLCTGYTWLQTIPMPFAWLLRLAPAHADIWGHALLPLGISAPAWAPLSLDPVAGRVQVLRGVLYVLTFLTAVPLTRSRKGRLLLEQGIVVSAVLLALVTYLHTAFGWERLFGVYSSVDRAKERVGPLFNGNHLSGYLNLGFCVALGLTLWPKQRASRPLAGLCCLVLAGGSLWAASRAGSACLLVGGLLVLGLHYAVFWRQQELSRTLKLLVPGGILAASLGMGMLASNEQVLHELTDTTNTSKFAYVLQTFRMVPTFLWFGVGRGAFESTFPAFRTELGYDLFTHPENLVAQWTTEWGVPVAALLALTLGYAFRPHVAFVRKRGVIGPWVALVVATLHNLLDFHSEVPAVGIALAVCGACVLSGGASSPQEASSPRTWRSWMWIGGGELVGLLALWGAFLSWGHEVGHDRDLLRRTVIDPQSDRKKVHEVVRTVLKRHPAEPYFPFLVGLRASFLRDEPSLPWFSRVLDRSPLHPPAHLAVARAVAWASPSHARMEYRIAFSQGARLSSAAFRKEILPLVHDEDDAMELVPPGRGRLSIVDQLASELRSTLPVLADQFDETLRREVPEHPGMLRRTLQRALAVLDDPVQCGGIARSGCVARACAAARTVQRMVPKCEGFVAEAELLVKEGKGASVALARLQDGVHTTLDRVGCARGMLRLSTLLPEETTVQDALLRFVGEGCTQDQECVDLLLLAAGSERKRGHRGGALKLYKQAYVRAPTSSVLETIAHLSAGLGLDTEAEAAWEELVQQDPRPAWKDALDRARRKRVMQKPLQKP